MKKNQKYSYDSLELGVFAGFRGARGRASLATRGSGGSSSERSDAKGKDGESSNTFNNSHFSLRKGFERNDRKGSTKFVDGFGERGRDKIQKTEGVYIHPENCMWERYLVLIQVIGWASDDALINAVEIGRKVMHGRSSNAKNTVFLRTVLVGFSISSEPKKAADAQLWHQRDQHPSPGARKYNGISTQLTHMVSRPRNLIRIKNQIKWQRRFGSGCQQDPEAAQFEYVPVPSVLHMQREIHR